MALGVLGWDCSTILSRETEGNGLYLSSEEKIANNWNTDEKKTPQTSTNLITSRSVARRLEIIGPWLRLVHVSIQFPQSVKRKEKTTIKCFSEGFLSYNLGWAAGGPFLFFFFLFFFFSCRTLCFQIRQKNTKRRVHLRAFGPDGSYYMEIAILKMNLIRSVVGAQLFYFRKKVIAVISTPVLYLGQSAYTGAIAQLRLV